MRGFVGVWHLGVWIFGMSDLGGLGIMGFQLQGMHSLLGGCSAQSST